MTQQQLRLRYGHWEVVFKSKGAGRKPQEIDRWVWDDLRGYRIALKSLFPHQYGLLLCTELFNAREWDEIGAAAYRCSITNIRKQYGLTKKEVAPFITNFN